jgi:thiol-disulfide isomerase/thioredoxin
LTENKSPLLKPVALIGLATVLGIVAGALAIYVIGPASVNAPIAEVATLSSDTDKACALTDAAKAKLNAAASGDVAAMIPVSEPRDMSALQFSGPDGIGMTMADFKGRTVLMNLWATWCVPCREEMPALNALQAKSGNASFEVVAVNVDSGEEEKRKAFLATQKIDALKDYHEPSMQLFNDLKRQGLAFGLPVTLLIGADGCLLSAMNGPANWSGDDALKFIAAAQEANVE